MDWRKWFLENSNWIIPTVITSMFALVSVFFTCTNLQIAKRQKDTVEAQLRLNLFEKRMAVYNAMTTVITNVTINQDSIGEDFLKYLIGTQDTAFLFGKDVNEELEEVKNILSRLYVIHLQFRPNSDGFINVEDSVSLNQERGHLVLELHEHLSEEPSLFKKYLDFSDCVITEEAQIARRT